MTKDLFIKYLQSKCTDEEFEQFVHWVANDSLSNSGKNAIREVWNEFEPEAGPIERKKYNQILDGVHHQINIKQNAKQLLIQEHSTKIRILTLATRVAAILLLPILALLLYTTFSDQGGFSNNLEISAPAGSRIQFELTDGTKVWLNHGSKLKYPYRFKGINRKVFLTGEAYFEVAHNKRIPFIVETKRLNVKATGTAFNVSAYDNDEIVNTTLVEGRVILYQSKTYQEISVLSPNQSLKFDSDHHAYTLETDNARKYTSWKDGLLVFKNDPIAEVAKKLARWYNIDVEISDEKVKEYTYTATFTDETLSQVLDLLSLATPVNYKLTQSKKLPDGSFATQKVLIEFKQE